MSKNPFVLARGCLNLLFAIGCYHVKIRFYRVYFMGSSLNIIMLINYVNYDVGKGLPCKIRKKQQSFYVL